MAERRPIVSPSSLSELSNSDSLVFGVSIVISEQALTPATPTSGYGILYCKSNGNLYFKNDAGVELQLT